MRIKLIYVYYYGAWFALNIYMYGYRILKYSEINPYLLTSMSLLTKSNFDSKHGMSFNLMAEASAKVFHQLSTSAPHTEGPDFSQFAANSKFV